MTKKTLEAFEDLVSTIENKLNAIKEQYPINRDQLPKV